MSSPYRSPSSGQRIGGTQAPTKSTVDDVFSAIGDLGPFSRKVYVLLNCAWLYAAMVTLFMVFGARKPGDWSCSGADMTAGQIARAAAVGVNCTLPGEAPVIYHDDLLDSSAVCDVFPSLDVVDFVDPRNTVVGEWRLICESDIIVSRLNSLFFVGFLFGAGTFGALADVIGRFRVFYITLVLTMLACAFSMLSGSWEVFLVSRILAGFGVGGFGLMGYVLGNEFVGATWRGTCGTASSGFFSVGTMLLSGVAFIVPQWRTLILTIQLFGVPYLLMFRWIPESPRWLLACGRTGDAQAVMDRVAAENGRPIPDNLRFRPAVFAAGPGLTLVDSDGGDQAPHSEERRRRFSSTCSNDSASGAAPNETRRVSPTSADAGDALTSADRGYGAMSQTSHQPASPRGGDEGLETSPINLEGPSASSLLRRSPATRRVPTFDGIGSAADQDVPAHASVLATSTKGSKSASTPPLSSSSSPSSPGRASAQSAPAPAPAPSAVSLFLMLFSHPFLRTRSVVMVICWFVASLVYYGLSLSAGDLGGNLYVTNFLEGLVEIPSYWIASLLLSRLGRKRCTIYFFALACVACFGSSAVQWSFDECEKDDKGVETCDLSDTGTLINLPVAMLGKAGIASAFAVLFVYAGELFPTTVRSAGIGMSSMAARCGGIVAPIIIATGSIHVSLPMLCFSGLSFIASAASLRLPETMGKKLPATVEDLRGTAFVSHAPSRSVGQAGFHLMLENDEDDHAAPSSPELVPDSRANSFSSPEDFDLGARDPEVGETRSV